MLTCCVVVLRKAQQQLQVIGPPGEDGETGPVVSKKPFLMNNRR